MKMKDKQLQVCLGGLLGDSSISPRNGGKCRIKFNHTASQLPYLEYKKKIMESYIIAEKPTYTPSKEVRTNKPFRSNPIYTYMSITHQDFRDIFGMLYRNIKGRNQRVITMKFLMKLSPLALLIWYLDDGTLTQDKEARIGSYRYSLSEHRTIKKWLKQQYGIDAIIAPYNIKGKVNRFFLRMRVKDSKLLFTLLNEYFSEIPPCMHYKFIKF